MDPYDMPQWDADNAPTLNQMIALAQQVEALTNTQITEDDTPPPAPAPSPSLDPFGIVAFDSFTGTPDEQLEAAKTHVGQQTYKQVVVMAANEYRFNDTHPLSVPGFTMTRLGATGREFESGCRIVCPPGGLFSVTGAKDFTFRGLSFEGTNNGAFVEPSSPSGSQGVWLDLTITDCGFKLFGPDFFQGALTRANFHRWYVNSGLDTQMRVGGSDSSLFTEGVTFFSSRQQSSRQELINTGALANTNVGKVYLTPQGGRGLVVPNGRMGLSFHDFTVTDPNRSGTKETQGAAITVSGGEGVAFYSPVIFCANAGATDGNPDPGDIVVTGGHDHLFVGPVFTGGYSGVSAPNTGQPAIYTTVPITVVAPIAVGGRPKVLQQTEPGLITCTDPSWQIVTAA